MATRLFRLFMAVIILAGLALSIPAQVSAAALPTFKILSVKADESITVRTQNFPANKNFTVRMDVAGNMGIDGIVVSEFNTGSGGSFEATYKIPAELKGKKTLAIRFEGDGGYYSYDWFNNRTQTFTDTGSVPSTGTGTSSIPYITVIAVDEDKQITVEARNLEANTEFKVRVGPFYTFSRQGVVVRTFNSGKGGKVVFNVTLPSVVKDVDLVAIRIDGGRHFAYNAFTNADSGTISSDTIAPVGYSCSVVSVTPGSSINRKSEFDAVWEVKNTGSKDWNLDSIDYKYVSGTKMHKFDSAYDLPKTVKSGEKVKIVVDMVAPSTTGWYTTNWAVAMGSTNLCSLSLTLRIN